jgi:hypothetical protein
MRREVKFMSETVESRSAVAELEKDQVRVIDVPVLESVTDAELQSISAGVPGTIGGRVW